MMDKILHLSLKLFSVLAFVLASLYSVAQVDLQITEIFSGQAGTDLTADWFEIQNMGDVAWTAGVDPDLYYDDESASASEADLIQGIVDIQPGESVIVLVTDNVADITIFNTIWSPVIALANIEIGYTDGAGLGGGGDVVNIWVGDPSASSPVDTESYPDTAADDGKSYDVSLGVFSTIGNANGAVQTLALGGANSDVPNIASPGNQGPVTVDPNAPVITGNEVAASPFLQISLDGPSPVCADLGDPTDPVATLGIPFNLADANTPLTDLILTVSSDNQTVVPDANLSISGIDSDRVLTINPLAVGYTNITVTVTDLDALSDSYVINLAVSDATIDPSTTRFHVGTSDGSTAQAVDADYMWVADDENQTIRLYDRHQSGLPIYEMNFNSDLGSDNEVDTEGSFRNGSTIFWMGSHTNQERSVVFSTTEAGDGAAATLAFSGFYDDLREDLINWDNNNGHGLGEGYLGFASGFEIEGLSADPNNPQGALLAFRGPLIDGNALIVPVENFQTIISMNPFPNSALFGVPIELDLEGHSLRSIECNDNGCLLIAGPFETTNDFRLFTWTGNAEDTAELRAVDLTAQTNMSAFEGIVALPEGMFLGAEGDADTVSLLVDTGTFDYYEDGTEAKDLPNEAWKKFRSEIVVLGAVEVPPIANPGEVVITEIMQNPAAVADDAGEWFELFNNTNASIDINGWTIADNGADAHVIDNGGPLIIPGGEYLVLGNNSEMATNGGVPVDYQYASITLSNSDDELILIAPDLVEVDRVEWDGGPLFPDPNGASMALQSANLNNNEGANWCEAVTTFGDGGFGTPGADNDCAPPPVADLRITEIWAGQDGDDLTADWFEITNFGDIAWVSAVDGDLFYDDDSQDPASAEVINGISDIQPGESVVVLVDTETAVSTFVNVWGPDYDLSGVEIGWTDGAGIGQGGDGVTLFVGGPTTENIVDFGATPAAISGVSYDLVLNEFSIQGGGMVQLGTNVAVATTATAGSDGLEPAIGSPGNQGPLTTQVAELVITEIFAGQEGGDLTEDWFEIKNTGTTAWVSGVDPDLYYDDESSDAADAVVIQGVSEIQPGATAIVLITDNAGGEVDAFIDVWSAVIDLSGVGIGYADGAGLGGGGDLVTLWMGDPTASTPIDTASYPDTAPFDGQSYDVSLQAFSEVGNANGAVQTLALGGDNMDVPNIGSPGDGLAVPPVTGLEITEIFSGQEGSDLTADWFEIKNTGTTAWVSGVDPDLYYDDESSSAADAVVIQGVSEIQPGVTAIVLITDNAGGEVDAFIDVWSAVIDLSGVGIGYADGAGLGGGGDLVTLWMGDPTASTPIDTASYPDTAPFDGQSYDVSLQAFSEVGNANGAVQTLALGGDNMDVPNIGSPGDGLAVPPVTGLEITEIFSGQEGADLTADWIEIKNNGDVAWVSGVDPDLYYDDESAAAADAVLIQGITDIQPGESVIVLITDNLDDIGTFVDVWSPVIDLEGIEIGSADGAGLGGGGDAVTLWLGDPNAFLPIDMESYSDTAPFDGQSYDSDLGEFSVVDNANGAVATLALGGDNLDVPNIGSPGNQGPISSVEDYLAEVALRVFPNPTAGHINIEPIGTGVIEMVNIYNMAGQLILTKRIGALGTFEMNISELPAALYYLKVHGEEGLVTKRIVKQ